MFACDMLDVPGTANRGVNPAASRRFPAAASAAPNCAADQDTLRKSGSLTTSTMSGTNPYFDCMWSYRASMNSAYSSGAFL